MPFRTRMMPLFASVLAFGLLSGCASRGITEAAPDHSRAWNLTHSVGMTDLKDSEVPSDQIPSSLGAAADMAIDVAYFMDSATLAMSFGDAFGLGLVGLLTTNQSHGERSTIVAWIPEDEVESRETAHIWLGDALKEATMRAMDELSIEGEPEFHNKFTDSFMRGTYTETKISGVKADGTKCGVSYKVHPENISELTTIPAFIAENAKGYQLYAGDDIVYPPFAAYCRSDTSLDQYIEFVSEISKYLPETVFLYTRYAELEDDQLPPMVHDHGKVLLFLTEEK